jgi:hypothetical protein
MNQPPDNDHSAPPNNHDAADALVGMLTPGADPVRKISVMPGTMSLGAALSAPDGSRAAGVQPVRGTMPAAEPATVAAS